jgi:hypothetical protein
MKFKTALAVTALALTVPVAVHAAESVNVISSQNADGSTTTTTTTTRYYYDTDKNNNGILDSQEFPAYVYHRWDRNGDGFLSADEWDRSAMRWYGPTGTAHKTYSV